MQNMPIAPESPSPSSAASRRRNWVVGAVAGVAALAGAGLAWRNLMKGSNLQDDAASGAGGDAAQALWQLKFDTPNGTPLAMASFRGKPVLLNFWATWCPPCVEELPLINRFFQENSKNGWQVLGIAVDQLPAVNKFLNKMPLVFPVALAGLSGIELSKSLGNLSGSLPFTVLLGGNGDVLHRKMGQVTPDDLRVWSTLK